MSNVYSSKQISVAIIEDNEAIVDMYEMKLKKEGYKVYIGKDGLAGYEIIEKYKPDIVLLDLMLPYMNGTEILRKIRGEEWGKDMHVIIVTNIDRSEAPKELNKLNFDRYIVKALTTPHQIIDAIKSITS